MIDKKPTVVFAARGYWETDFILRDLLPPNLPVVYATPQSFVELSFYASNNIGCDQCVLVFSSNHISFKDVFKIAAQLKPLLIFHLSDEGGKREEYAKLSEHTRLLLRQYNHPTYRYSSNTKLIPLGYAANMLNGSSLDLGLKPSAQRAFAWSFVGNTEKSDRSKIIEKMISANLGRYELKNNILPTELFSIYANTIFVPNGRGYNVLDCFRIYEATVCGAIPIIVGKGDELKTTFYYEENPPWIMAENWNDALKACKTLLQSPEEMNKRQGHLLAWWNYRIKTLQNTIQYILFTV